MFNHSLSSDSKIEFSIIEYFLIWKFFGFTIFERIRNRLIVSVHLWSYKIRIRRSMLMHYKSNFFPKHNISSTMQRVMVLVITFKIAFEDFWYSAILTFFSPETSDFKPWQCHSPMLGQKLQIWATNENRLDKGKNMTILQFRALQCSTWFMVWSNTFVFYNLLEKNCYRICKFCSNVHWKS